MFPESSNLNRVLLPGFVVIAAAYFAIRVWQGIWFLPFMDEAEHLLGGQMLNRGAILYRDFITQHGPVTFTLTQLYGAIFGWAHPNGARLISPILALFAAICVVSAPIEPTRLFRPMALALFLALEASVWLVQGIYFVNYHAIAGFLLASSFAVFVVPLWCGTHVDRRRGFVSGVCLVLVPATAYSFAPAAALIATSVLVASAHRDLRGPCLGFLAGLLAGACGVLAWLLLFGDIIGYVAFHFIENQIYFAPYLNFTFKHFLLGMVPSLLAANRVHTLALLACTAAFVLLLAIDASRKAARPMRIPIVIGLIGMVTLCARGATLFQDGTFLTASLALLSLALPCAMLRILPPPSRDRPLTTISVIVIPIFIAELFAADASYATHYGIKLTQEQIARHYDLGISRDPIYRRIRALVRADEKILSLPYAPADYFAANRQPMNRYFYYLPWDEDYARAPWFGQDHDLCADLSKLPPSLIIVDPWLIDGGIFGPHVMPCFHQILAERYRQQKDFPTLYLRNDLTDRAESPQDLK